MLGSPFDYPLSSRFDENDSILVLDRVLVPWENVFMYDAEAREQLRDGVRLPAALHVPRLHAPGRQARLHRRLPAEGDEADRLRRLPRRADAGRRGAVLAQPVLGPVRRDGPKSPEQWVGDAVQPNTAYGLAYRTFMGQRLRAREGDHRADDRLGADLPQLVGRGLQEPGDPARTWTSTSAGPTASPRSTASSCSSCCGTRRPPSSAAATSCTSATTAATTRPCASRRSSTTR